MNSIYIAFFAFLNLLFYNNDIPVYEYEIQYNLGKSLVKKGYVFETPDKVHFTATKSVFLEDMPKLSVNQETGIPNINVMHGVQTENFITYKTTSKLEHLTSVGKLIYVTQEDILQQEWKPTGVSKTVSGRDCIEMTTRFRGRDYIAYVDLSIPFSHGPWKFNSFPGLPVVIKDTEGKLSWTLTQIFSKSKEEVTEFEKEQAANFMNYEKIDLQEYDQIYLKTRGGVATMHARMPRDFEQRKNFASFKRGGLELEYAWDNKEEDN